MQYNLIKDIKADYYLESAQESFLKVVIPQPAVNYVRNPLMQGVGDFLLPTGYLLFFTSGQNASLRTDSNETESPVWQNYYRVNATSATTRLYYIMGDVAIFGSVTCSVTFRTAIDTTATIAFNTFNKSDTRIHHVKGGEWTTLSISGIAPFYSFGVTVTDKTTIDFAHFQCEDGDKATSPIHGFMGNGYKWVEYPHASFSVRDETVLNSGLIVPFKDFGIILTEATGLGASELNVNAINLVQKSTRLLQNIQIDDRTVSFGYQMYTRNFEQLVRKHSKASQALIDTNKPRTFIFSSDCHNVNEIEFSGVLTEGLSWEFNSFHGEELGFDIEMISPFFGSTKKTHHYLNGTYLYENQGLMLMKQSGLTQPTTMPVLDSIDEIHVGKNKQLYMVGKSGSTVTIYQYDGNYWKTLATTLAGNNITALHQDSKYLYVGIANRDVIKGSTPYTGQSGAGMSRINLITKKVEHIGNIDNVSGPGEGVPRISVFETDDDGNLYAGGNFAQITYNSVTVATKKVAVFFKSGSWANLSGLELGASDGGVIALYFDNSDNKLYIGGDFRNATGLPFYGDATKPYAFSIWDRETATHMIPRPDFPLITIPPADPLVGFINKIIKFEERIYIIGTFDITVRAGVSSDTVVGVGVWNGDIGLDSASNVVGQITNVGGYTLGTVAAGHPSPVDAAIIDNKLVVVGNFDQIINTNTGEITEVSGAVEIYNNAIYEHKPLTLITEQKFDNYLTHIETYGNYDIDYVFGKRTIPSNNIVLPSPNLVTLPTLTMSDEIDLFIYGTTQRITEIANLTTRSHIYFDHTFDTSEIVHFQFYNGKLKVLSSIYGDITYKVATGSTPGNFYLIEGTNDIRLYYTNTGVAKNHLSYRLKSIDGTVLLNKNTQ